MIIILISCQRTVKIPLSQKEVTSKHGMVVSAHALASMAGKKILAMGGNAIDAAIAVHFALAIVYPRAGNLGGGGFALILDPDHQCHSLDFREMAPMKSYESMYLNDLGAPIEGLSLEGGLAVGIPGSVDGMISLHERYGQMGWKQILEEVIPLAQWGFPIGKEEADRLNHYRDDFLRWNKAPSPFVKKEKWQSGDILRQKNLARTLKIIAHKGRNGFYSGVLAENLVEKINEKGGIITVEDMGGYHSKWRTPIAFTFGEYQIWSMPPPSSGGIALGQILGMLEQQPFQGFHRTQDLHRIVEAERRAFADRSQFLGDPDYVNIPKDSLLSKRYLIDRMRDYNPNMASKSGHITSGRFDWNRESFETTHYCVADENGWVVSVTTTLNSNYGSKVFIPKLGFFMNNEMDDFSVKPGVPNQFGLIGNKANAIEPGKRMLSSMTPTVLTKDGEFFLTLGTPGGSTIITSVAQVILNVISYDMTLYDAVQAPRFHHQWWPDVVMYESQFDSNAIAQLNALGHETKMLQKIGLVEAIMKTKDGRFIGVADERSEDAAAGL